LALFLARVMEVSAVVPTRNRSRLLPMTLRSVLRQSDVRLEIVVVDDASTDETRDVVAAFGDPRIRLIRNATPMGPNAARNRGAKEARGEWLAFVDDDDLWAPTKLARQVGVATEDGYAWVYAGAVNVDDHLRIIHGAPAPDPAAVVAALPHSNPIPAGASNVMIHRDAFEAVGGFNQDLRACEEWDLWLRLARIESPGRVPSPLVAYRMHAGNAILDVAAIVEGARAFERLHGATIDWGLFHRWLAQSSARGGDRRRALREFGRAALAGQAREVGWDLIDLARAGVRRRLGRARKERGRGSDDAWEEEARGWLEDLRRLQIDACDER
jgi:glycosyltransferase involved in cell wall biosynthesis